MHYLVGHTSSFAVELELSGDKWDNRTAIWLNNIRIGDWDDKNLVAPFLRSLRRVALKHNEFWENELDGLNCYQLFLAIHPFYNNPDDFYSLAEIEMNALLKFDKFLIFWGENFDAWALTIVYKDASLTFLWRYSPNGNEDSYETRNDIKCFDVALSEVKEVYNKLVDVLPREIWPND